MNLPLPIGGVRDLAATSGIEVYWSQEKPRKVQVNNVKDICTSTTIL